MEHVSEEKLSCQGTWIICMRTCGPIVQLQGSTVLHQADMNQIPTLAEEVREREQAEHMAHIWLVFTRPTRLGFAALVL